jgi:23S rRNA (uracil1939-C5)-methyltransferase
VIPSDPSPPPSPDPPLVEVTAGDLVAGGRAFARLDDGTPLFVAGALPGERVRVRVLRRRARVAEGIATEILAPAAERVPPPCPWADRCGGCDWMGLEYGSQLTWKHTIATEAGRRIGKLDAPPPEAVLASPTELGYRGRIRVHVDRAGQIGFFARGSHAVVPIDRCAVAEDGVNRALAALRRAVADDPAGFGRQVSGAELRTGDQATPWAAHLFWRQRRARPDRRLTRALAGLAASGGAVWAAGEVLHGPARVTLALTEELTLHAGPLAFLQANPAANRGLVARVRALATELSPSGGRFVDLFCGAGNFTLPLLAAGMRGVGVELSRAAIEDARFAATAQGLDAGAFHAGRAGGDLASLAGGARPELLLLDPPRTGAADAVPGIVELGPAAVIYVSCDPVTLARDARALCDGGYTVHSWTLHDLFPQTHHVESVLALSRVL